MSNEDERIVLDHFKAGEKKTQIVLILEADPNAPHLTYYQVITICRNYFLCNANPPPNNPRGRPTDLRINELILDSLDETPTASTS